MYVANKASFRAASARWESGHDSLPPEVTRLYRREREIAEIVYERGLATATDVQAELSAYLSNPAIRSMLNRLVSKGVLTKLKCGPRGTFVYGPALTRMAARETALRQFAEDFYAGSLPALAEAIADLFASDQLPRAAARKGGALRLAS